MLGGRTEGYAVVEVGLGAVVMSMECRQASRRYVYVHRNARTRQDRFSHVGRAVVERWHEPRHLDLRGASVHLPSPLCPFEISARLVQFAFNS
jgi:hypothetical protein